MATYITTMHFTEQGIKTIQDTCDSPVTCTILVQYAAQLWEKLQASRHAE